MHKMTTRWHSVQISALFTFLTYLMLLMLGIIVVITVVIMVGRRKEGWDRRGDRHYLSIGVSPQEQISREQILVNPRKSPRFIVLLFFPSGWSLRILAPQVL